MVEKKKSVRKGGLFGTIVNSLYAVDVMGESI